MNPLRRTSDADHPLVKGRADLEQARAAIRAVEARRFTENAAATRTLTFALWITGR